MAINYPTSLDTLTNPTGTDALNSPDHAGQHSNINDIAEALQAKVGIGASTALVNTVLAGTGTGVTAFQATTGVDAGIVSGTAGSVDEFAKWNTDGDVVSTGYSVVPIASGGTGQITATASFDALSPLTTQGDVMYHDGSNNVRLAKGTTGQLLTQTATIPAWSAAATVGIESAIGVIDLSLYQPLNTSDFTAGYQDVFAVVVVSGTTVKVQTQNSVFESYAVTGDYAAADDIVSHIILGGFLYLMLNDAGAPENRIYRYDPDDLASGGTLMTISGTAFGTAATRMTSDGTDFYFTDTAGNTSGSNHIISKYTLSGTTLTFDSDITCGSTAGFFEWGASVDASGNIYGWNTSTDVKIRKYNSSGTIQSTSAVMNNTTRLKRSITQINGNYFMYNYDSGITQMSRVFLV